MAVGKFVHLPATVSCVLESLQFKILLSVGCRKLGCRANLIFCEYNRYLILAVVRLRCKYGMNYVIL